MKVDLFDQFSDAEEAYNRLMAHKQSRGYRHPMQQI